MWGVKVEIEDVKSGFFNKIKLNSFQAVVLSKHFRWQV